MDKISVVVPVYNVKKYLEKSFESIADQTYDNLEIVLVDDGATDGSGKLCDELAKKDNRVKVCHKVNGGLSSARNHGLLNATGDYIIFIDSDDYIHPDMISSLYSEIKRTDSDGAVCGIMNVYNTKEVPQCSDTEIVFECDREKFLKELLIGEKIPGSVCNKLIKKEIADKLQFPVGKIYEDAFYHLDLVKAAKSYVVITKPYYYYFHRGDSITTQKYNPRKLHMIEAYTGYIDYINNEFPSLKDEAFFRLAYAHFVVLDSMLLVDDYKKLPDYKNVVGFLKKNAFKIAHNHIFRKGRRIAALALKVNVGIYRALMLQDLKKNKGIN